MAKDRQITLGVKIDPALWERPEFNSQQQNPFLPVWLILLKEYVNLDFR